jgi:ferredoxin
VTGVHSGTAILVDPKVRAVGIDLDALVAALSGSGTGRTTLVPGLARHPELLAGVVRASRARKAVVVTAEFEQPPISELRMWGEASGLAPLGVQVVALDILRAHRSSAERSAYAVRMVRAAVAALDGSDTAPAVRRPVGASLSRRALLRGRATTWVPVIEIDPVACQGTQRCERCVEACPVAALQIQDAVLGGPPVVDANRCQACSACLDVCPSGALSLDGHDSGFLIQQLRALLQRDDGAVAPCLVIACESAAAPLHHLGEQTGLPGWLVLELACLGGVGSAWHLAALAAGARAVQVLPCERCLDRASLPGELSFTRRLLTALGDVDASRRVGMLPARGLRLQRAIGASNGLSALVDRIAAVRFPEQEAIRSSAQVAAAAVGAIRTALGNSWPNQGQRPGVIQGPGAPLGVLRTGGGCTACAVCVRSCPTRALAVTAGPGVTELFLDPAACTGCGVCVQACPEGVLNVLRGVDLDLLDGGCVRIAGVALAGCPDCGESVPALPASVHLPPLPTRLAGRCPECRRAALLAAG